ncbi:MAG: hypothetical protein E5X36_03535 [Mesorhizobium sp.]|nr:MAG: hypothetical protein E5X36_03535 [Mesorhizobium sp.]
MLAIKVDKRPISQAQLVGFLVIIMSQAFLAGGVYYKFQSLSDEAAKKSDLVTLTNKVDDQAADRDMRQKLLDRNLDAINDKLKPLDNVTYRLDQMDKRDDAQDARIDKLLEVMGAKLDALNAAVADVKADVRVVAQDVKNLSTKSQPTAYRSP